MRYAIGAELRILENYIMSENNKDLKGQWGTHLPILMRLVDLTDGPILEMGTGVWSTPVLDFMCRETKRKLVSYDNDPDWHEHNQRWQSDYHDIKLVEDWDKADIESTTWSIAFIDHKPAKRRKVDMGRIANNALFVVIHDSEPESDKYFKYSWAYKHYKYRYDYTKCRPNTTILSNFTDLSFLDIK